MKHTQDICQVSWSKNTKTGQQICSTNCTPILEDANHLIQAGTEHVATQQDTDTDGEDNVSICLSGQYEFEVTHEVLEKIDMHDTIDIVWLMGNSKKNHDRKFKLKRELVHCPSRKIKESQEEITKIVGHTRAIVTSPATNNRSIFYARPCCKGKQWYDWVMVHFEETNNLGDEVENYYPSRLLGFITTNGTRKVLIQCSINPIDWEVIQQNFIVETQLGTNLHVSFVIVPIDSIVHPLCMFPDDGSNLMNKYFVVLPQKIGIGILAIISFFIKERHVHK